MTMKFNAIVGNPPYQTMATGDAKGSDPIYHKFMDLGMDASNEGTLIHPGRFLFHEGKTPKAWNEKMLASTHFKVLKYFPRSGDVFASVDIEGGLAITCWNEMKSCSPVGDFVAFDWLRTVLTKVKDKNFRPFSTIVYARTIYRLSEKLYEENPWARNRPSRNHQFDLSTNVFRLFPELFTDSPKAEDNVKIYGLSSGNKRVYKNVKRDYINPPDNFGFYKVMIPKCNGSGAIGVANSTDVIGRPVIGEPNVGHTETFLSIGKFAHENEATACLKFVKTKFARMMLGTLKVTQHNSRETWSNVPLQDFTDDSDIDWSKGMREIDEQLYAKYKLSQDEIMCIEQVIRPME